MASCRLRYTAPSYASKSLSMAAECLRVPTRRMKLEFMQDIHVKQGSMAMSCKYNTLKQRSRVTPRRLQPLEHFTDKVKRKDDVWPRGQQREQERAKTLQSVSLIYVLRNPHKACFTLVFSWS